MNIKRIATALTRPRVLAPTVFLAVGTGKTMLDYEKAKPEKKSRILAKDSAMLLGSLAGFLLMNPISRKICKSSEVHKTYLKSMQYVLTQSIAGVLNTFGGIAGAVCGNEFVHKYVLNKPYFINNTASDKAKSKKAKSKQEAQKEAVENEEKQKLVQNIAFLKESNVFKNFNYVNKTAVNTASAMLSLPGMSVFTAVPMIALTGMSVAKLDGYNNKIKRTSKELIANSLIPSLLVAGVSLAVENKKNYIKYPALLAALIGGAYAGREVADLYQDKLDETIDSIDFQNIDFKRAFKGRFNDMKETSVKS